MQSSPPCLDARRMQRINAFRRLAARCAGRSREVPAVRRRSNHAPGSSAATAARSRVFLYAGSRRCEFEASVPFLAIVALTATLAASPSPADSPSPGQASPLPSIVPSASPLPKGPNSAAQPEYILAEAEFKAGNNAAAVNDFNQAIQLDPNFLGSYLDRGNAEVRLGQLEDASVD